MSDAVQQALRQEILSMRGKQVQARNAGRDAADKAMSLVLTAMMTMYYDLYHSMPVSQGLVKDLQEHVQPIIDAEKQS